MREEDQFTLQKKQSLHKLLYNDKSKKKSIDKKIKKLTSLINSYKDTFTLSTCSGRISIRTNEKKKLDKTYYTTHKLARTKTIWKVLEHIEKQKIQKTIWFKQESCIIHLQARTLQLAQKIIAEAKECGFNRCGIISLQKKVVMELIHSSHIHAPIYKNKILITKKYLSYLITHANKFQRKSLKAIQNLEKYFKNQIYI